MSDSPQFTPPSSRDEPFVAPPWAAQPTSAYYLLESDGVDTIVLESRAAFIFGRPEKAHVAFKHESISRQQAALVHHSNGKWYAIDLKSAFGTQVNSVKIPPYTPKQVNVDDKLKFGSMEQEYSLRLGEPPRDSKKRPLEDLSTSSESKRAKKEVPTQAKITRTKDEALQIITGLRDQITSGKATFEAIAREQSDCSSAKAGGDLGPFGPGAMVPEFEKATFALPVGGLSEPVLSPSGVHIILRTA